MILTLYWTILLSCWLSGFITNWMLLFITKSTDGACFYQAVFIGTQSSCDIVLLIQYHFQDVLNNTAHIWPATVQPHLSNDHCFNMLRTQPWTWIAIWESLAHLNGRLKGPCHLCVSLLQRLVLNTTGNHCWPSSPDLCGIIVPETGHFDPRILDLSGPLTLSMPGLRT